MLIGGAKMEKYVYSILPFSDENKKNVLNEINMIVTSNAIGIPLLAIIQADRFARILDIRCAESFPFRLSDLFCHDHSGCGYSVGLVAAGSLYDVDRRLGECCRTDAYALIIITNVDNLIRFILQKKMADTHPLITIFGVIIGLSLFGFMGIIFGPLLISIFILCFNIFKEKYLDNAR